MTSRWTPGQGIATVAAIALGTGLLEAAILSARYRLFRVFTWTGSDAFWMAPLAYLALYGAPALLLAPIWHWKPAWANPWTVVAPFAGLSVYLLLLTGFTTQVHWLAGLLLSTGAAVQMSRRLGTRATAPQRGAPVAMALLILTLGLALGQVLLPGILARSRSETAPPAGAPNILLIILDTVRAQSLSLYGYERPTTPSLSRWARRGVVFDSAYAPSPWTLPSHGTIFTGRPHRELAVDWLAPLDRRHPVLAEGFSADGYRTAGFVANWYYTTRQSGLARGFGEYHDFRRSAKQVVLSSTPGQLLFSGHPGRYDRERDVHRKNAGVVSAEFLGWAAHDDTRPFFAFLNFFDAHKPYVTPPTGDPDFVAGRSATDRYDGNIWYIDREVGGLLQELERAGTLANTVVVITSDHGELFGEHGLEGHGNSLYLPSLHVPLILLGAGMPWGLHVSRPVSLVDLAATLEDLRGTGHRALPGRSLVGCWTGSACEPSIISAAVGRSPKGDPESPGTLGPLVTVLADGWQYIRNSTGEEQLYRLTPGGSERNRKGEPGLAETVGRLRRLSEPYTLPTPKGP